MFRSNVQQAKAAERIAPVKHLTRADALASAIWWANQGAGCSLAPAQSSCAQMSQAWSAIAGLISPPHFNTGPK